MEQQCTGAASIVYCYTETGPICVRGIGEGDLSVQEPLVKTVLFTLNADNELNYT